MTISADTAASCILISSGTGRVGSVYSNSKRTLTLEVSKLRKIASCIFLLVAIAPSFEYSFARIDERRGVQSDNFYHIPLRVNGRPITPYFLRGSPREGDLRNIRVYLSRVTPLRRDFLFQGWANITSSNLVFQLYNRDPNFKGIVRLSSDPLVDAVLRLEPYELLAALKEPSSADSSLKGYVSWVSRSIFEVITYSPHSSVRRLSGLPPSLRVQSRSLVSGWIDNCIPIPRSYHPRLNTLISKTFKPNNLISRIYFGVQDSEAACLRFVGLPLSIAARIFSLLLAVFLGVGSLLVALPGLARRLVLVLGFLLSGFLFLLFFS